MRKIFSLLWQLRRGVVAICLLYFGGYQLYLGTAFHHRQTISYTDFARTMPKIGWFHVTGVPLDYGLTTIRETSNNEPGVYVPAVDPSGSIALLIASDDKAEPDANSQIRKTKDVDGTVEYGTDIETTIDRDLRPLQKRLAPNYRVIDEGQKPAFVLGLVLGIFGLVVGLLVAFSALGSLRKNVKID